MRKLVLYGGYALGWKLCDKPDEVATGQAMVTLTRTGWGRNNPAFRQIFTSLFFPDMPPKRLTGSTNSRRFQHRSKMPCGFRRPSGRSMCGTCCLRWQRRPLSSMRTRMQSFLFSSGRSLAAGIPHSRFVQLDSRNHFVLEYEQAWSRAAAAIEAFLETERE